MHTITELGMIGVFTQCTITPTVFPMLLKISLIPCTNIIELTREQLVACLQEPRTPPHGASIIRHGASITHHGASPCSLNHPPHCLTHPPRSLKHPQQSLKHPPRSLTHPPRGRNHPPRNLRQIPSFAGTHSSNSK